MLKTRGKKQINGTELYCNIIGDGTPIVILHGGPGLDHTYLLPQMERLAKHHTLIFFDQRACGRSSMDVDTNSLTMSNLIDDIEGVRKVFHLKKINLMGHSWGGLLAMRYAVEYPENLGSLILVTTTPASSELRRASLRIMEERVSKADSAARVALMKTDDFKERTPKAMAEFFRILFKGSFYRPELADSLTLKFGPSYPISSRLMQHLSKDKTAMDYDLHPQLGRINCPTLIIGGDFDQVPPETNQRIHEGIKGSEYILLKNCGHFPYIEKPDEFFGAIRSFMTKQHNTEVSR